MRLGVFRVDLGDDVLMTFTQAERLNPFDESKLAEFVDGTNRFLDRTKDTRTSVLDGTKEVNLLGGTNLFNQRIPRFHQGIACHAIPWWNQVILWLNQGI